MRYLAFGPQQSLIYTASIVYAVTDILGPLAQPVRAAVAASSASVYTVFFTVVVPRT